MTAPAPTRTPDAAPAPAPQVTSGPIVETTCILAVYVKMKGGVMSVTVDDKTRDDGGDQLCEAMDAITEAMSKRIDARCGTFVLAGGSMTLGRYG